MDEYYDDIWGEEGGRALRLEPHTDGTLRIAILSTRGAGSTFTETASVTIAGFRLIRIAEAVAKARSDATT